jgi:hypothetical protein
MENACLNFCELVDFYLFFVPKKAIGCIELEEKKKRISTMRSLPRYILLAAHAFLLTDGFQLNAPPSSRSPSQSFSSRRIPTDAETKSHRQQNTRLGYSPDDPFSRNDDDSSNSAGWIESLKARASELDEQEEQRISRWKNATCSSKVAVVLPDWVRRLDVDYPLAICGSARGYLYVTHLVSGEVLASNLKPESEQESDDTDEALASPTDLEQTLRLLYGSFDGGGTLAVAFSGSRICSADRGEFEIDCRLMCV